MMSEWSAWMLMGAEMVRLTLAMTMGRRMPAAMGSSSYMSARPCEEVAVTAREPAADAPMVALMAECSLSTLTYSVCTRPSATNLSNSSTMMVWGVMGYAAMTSGSAWRSALATMMSPDAAKTVWVAIMPAPRFASRPAR